MLTLHFGHQGLKMLVGLRGSFCCPPAPWRIPANICSFFQDWQRQPALLQAPM